MSARSRVLRWLVMVTLVVWASAAAQAATPADIRAKVEHDHPGLIPSEAMDKAFGYLADHSDKVANQNYLTIIDFTQPSTVKRCHVIDLRTGEVETLLVAHARNTGVDRAERFSNENGSNKSSLGVYLTGELYQGKHGLSMRLDGMEPTNDNARRRAIVMHGADYVSPKVIQQQGRLGRSLGCPALEMNVIERIVRELNGKSVLLIYGKESPQATTQPATSRPAAQDGIDE